MGEPALAVWDGEKADKDDLRLNPLDKEIVLLTCWHVLVAVAEKDTLRDSGRRLAAWIRDDGHRNNLTLVESEGEDHGFHLYSPLRATSRKLMKSMAQFINQQSMMTTPSPLPTTVLPELHFYGSKGKTVSTQPTAIGVVPTARPLNDDVFGYGMSMKGWNRPVPCSRKTRYGLFLGTGRPNMAHRDPLSATVSISYAIKNFF